jgi:hypothetical protein
MKTLEVLGQQAVGKVQLTYAIINSSPFVKDFARQTEISAGLGYASGHVTGLSSITAASSAHAATAFASSASFH